MQSLPPIPKRILATLFAVSLVACSRTEEPPQVPVSADFVFNNTAVYTVNEAQPWAEAVAVRGNEIVYVGDVSGSAAFIGDSTEVFDLVGKMVLPGFFSAHEHLIASGWTALGVNLGDGQSLDDYLRMIKDYADANPEEEFIRI